MFEDIDFKSYDIKDDQICIASVPVGGLTPEMAAGYLQGVAKAFKEEIERAQTPKVAIFVFPKNSDGSSPDLNIFTPKDGEHYVIQAPVDGLPAKERIMYLKLLKEHIESEWPNKNSTISIVPIGTGMTSQSGYGTLIE